MRAEGPQLGGQTRMDVVYKNGTYELVIVFAAGEQRISEPMAKSTMELLLERLAAAVAAAGCTHQGALAPGTHGLRCCNCGASGLEMLDRRTGG